MKIATVVGARPQFIKAAAFSRAIATQDKFPAREILIHTGQHYDSNMSDIFFDEMELPKPHYHLGIGSGSHGAMTGRMLEAIERVLIDESPDWVVVYGDTNSTLAGALAAAKLHIPLAHVEAGLRSFNRKMPEEINRILADHSADLLFTPTANATKRLQKEGICESKIAEVGDIMYEAALYYGVKATGKSTILEKLGLSKKKYVLATIHRAENTDDPEKLAAVLDGLSLIAKHTPVVWPVHPRTRQAMIDNDLLTSAQNSLVIIEPLGYLDMLSIESQAEVIITDSGGVQKEAFFFKIPCLTLREETEWTELVEHGYNQLVPLAPKTILEAYLTACHRIIDWGIHLYGQGNAATQILEHLWKRKRHGNLEPKIEEAAARSF